MIEPFYKSDRVTLYNADCLEVLRQLPAGSVDAVVTDPPYGLKFPYNSYEDSQINLDRLIASFVPACLELAKRVVITPGNTNLTKYPPAKWNCAWTWDTTTARGHVGWSQWQPILFYGDDVYRGTKSHDGVLKSDRIHFSGGQAKHERASGGGHCCPKPEAFMDRLIRRFTHKSETILDPFMGSGTTGVAAIKTGRKFIGIELDAGYCEIAKKRIQEAEAACEVKP